MKQNFNNQMKKDSMALEETKFSLPLQSVSKLSTIVSHLSFFLSWYYISVLFDHCSATNQSQAHSTRLSYIDQPTLNVKET